MLEDALLEHCSTIDQLLINRVDLSDEEIQWFLMEELGINEEISLVIVSLRSDAIHNNYFSIMDIIENNLI
jgi:hypothetical protein